MPAAARRPLSRKPARRRDMPLIAALADKFALGLRRRKPK